MIFRREEWNALWHDLADQTHGKELNAAAAICDRIKAEWASKYPGVDFSNGRFAVHIEQCLAAGYKVPDFILASVMKEDIRFDWASLPHLARLLGYDIDGFEKRMKYLQTEKETGVWKVKLRKLRSTWHWFTENPVGGGFGSNQVSSKRSALTLAIQNIPAGKRYQLFSNGTLEGEFVR